MAEQTDIKNKKIVSQCTNGRSCFICKGQDSLDILTKFGFFLFYSISSNGQHAIIDLWSCVLIHYKCTPFFQNGFFSAPSAMLKFCTHFIAINLPFSMPESRVTAQKSPFATTYCDSLFMHAVSISQICTQNGM